MPTVTDKVTTSTVLWGDVCQSVDPDPELPYPVFQFGGRIEKVWPRVPLAVAPEDDLVAEDSGYYVVTQGNQRIGV